MENRFEKKQLVKKSENFSQWYVEVVLRSELADYAPVKGCQVFRPYGFAVWENIKDILDREIKKAGVKNAYFPLFIPEKFLKKEKEHIEGFSPELAVVAFGGGKELKEKLVVRPTSETIIYEMYSKWIKSWRDLPLKINQWANVVRWEKRPRLFLRTTEFLWQEGHTCHSNYQEALEEAKRALKMYVDFYREYLAIDGVFGKKSPAEKFPGAEDTYTYEMLMPDGKALQGCTSHNLAQNFSKPFNIRFLDKEGKERFVWQTSWGITTRCIGAVVMVHGDDQGLIFPPKIAPIQIIIIPILDGKNDKVLIDKAEEIKEKLTNFRVEIDKRREYSPGWKFNQWELKGVPVRLEIGPREVKEKKVTLARRDNFQKIEIPLSLLSQKIKETLDSIQKHLFEKSSQFLKKATREVFDYASFKKIMEGERGFVRAFWCGNPECEEKIKRETKATIRVLPDKAPEEKGRCIYCQKPAKKRWLFAQAY